MRSANRVVTARGGRRRSAERWEADQRTKASRERRRGLLASLR